MSDAPGNGDNEPNLELPSLGFRRKRKSRGTDAATPDDTPAKPRTPDRSEDHSAEAASSVADPVAPAPSAHPAPAGLPSRPAGTPPVVPPPPRPAPTSTTGTPAAAGAASVRRTPPSAPPAAPPKAAPPAAAVPPSAPPRPAGPPVRPVTATGTGPGTPPPARPAGAASSPAGHVGDTAPVHTSEGRQDAQERPGTVLIDDEALAERPKSTKSKAKAKSPRPDLRLPATNPLVAAAVTGVLVGLLGVLLSNGASRGCEAVRGIGSCGGFGLVALLAILAIEVLVGSVLLKAFAVTDPASTSFLGVSLVAVLAMLFFLSSIDSWWMLLVIPALSALTFMLATWVTSTFIEGVEDR